MNDLLSLLQIPAALAAVIVPPILLARLLAGSGPVDLTNVFRSPVNPPRPAGVQEDDQPAFRFDRLEPRPMDRRPASSETIQMPSASEERRHAA